MREIFSSWRHWLPFVAAALLLAGAILYGLRRRPRDPTELERQRRAYLNRVGRIVEGQILDINEAPRETAAPHRSLFRRHMIPAGDNCPRKLLHYTYSISGVTYETAQDISGLEERACLGRIAAGQPASVKYDPANPSNSMLLADDWSGLN